MWTGQSQQTQPSNCQEGGHDAGAWKYASQLVTWALVIGGWVVVNRAAARRARRQEDLAIVQETQQRVGALRERAVQYYTTKRGDEHATAEDEAWIKYELKSLSSRLLHMKRAGYYDLASETIQLRQAITGGTFEASSRDPVSHEHEVIQRIWRACETLTLALRDECEKANKIWTLSS